MSMHNKNKYPEHNTLDIHEGLKAHGFEPIKPSQLSDAFRLGHQYALKTGYDAFKFVDYQNLRQCMGYVANGNQTSVSLGQDDATDDYTVTIGNRHYWGYSLSEALQKAADDNPND